MLSWEDNSKDYCFFELHIYTSFNTMNKEEDGRSWWRPIICIFIGYHRWTATAISGQIDIRIIPKSWEEEETQDMAGSACEEPWLVMTLPWLGSSLTVKLMSDKWLPRWHWLTHSFAQVYFPSSQGSRLVSSHSPRWPCVSLWLLHLSCPLPAPHIRASHTTSHWHRNIGSFWDRLICS